MISPLPSPTFTPSRSTPGKLHTDNDHPPLSPKRSFAQLEEDQPSQPELKRRDVQPCRRAPLDPLSASDLENRRCRTPQPTDSVSFHALVTPSSVPDLRLLHPEQPVSSGSCGMQRSDISDALVCSWPPPIPPPGTARTSHSGLVGQQASHCGRLHSPDENMPSRAAFLESTSTAWNAPDSLQTKPTATMTKTTGWKSDTVLQPIRSRTNSMPSIRRPPRELWQSDSGPTTADRDPIDTADSFVCPTPPGLPPRRRELRRSGSSSDLLPHGSVSLSLAHGSQPLSASEHTKAVPPIGAERSRVLSITPLRSHSRGFSATQSRDPSVSPWCSSPPSSSPQAKWKSEANSLKTTSLEKAQAAAGDASMSKEHLERLLRHTVRNKYAPKIVSPLSPLRTATSALDLSTDPMYQLRMPSHMNSPSLRYTQCPPRRARTICDGHQSLDWNTTCMHCQACKRDTIGKRLLAFRYRQQQTHQLQRNRLLVYPSRGSTMSIMDGDRIALAGRIREVFAYEMDEEEKNLWAEVAAVTGAGPLSFTRLGAPCAAIAHRRARDDGNDDGVYDEYLEMPDEGFLVNESATLFREVSVY